MDTGNLMSSLREMIDAAIDAKLAATHDQAESARLHYSRHETVVREALQEIGELLPPPRLGPRRFPTDGEVEEAVSGALANLKCYLCRKPVKPGAPHECHEERNPHEPR